MVLRGLPWLLLLLQFDLGSVGGFGTGLSWTLQATGKGRAMKRLLLATSSLALFGTGAYAEVSISGTAGFGVYYNSELPEFVAKHKFIHEVNVDFKVSGTTDGGLTFGGTAGFETNLDVMDLGTVYVGGDFGTLTIGDNDAADVIAGGIADVGLEGIGVDDVAEDIRGTSAAAIRYDNSFGQVSFAISAGSADGTPEMAGSAAEAAVPARPGHYGYTLGVARGIRQANDVFVATPEQYLYDDNHSV